MSRVIIFLLAVISTATATPIVASRSGVDGRLLGGVAVNLGQVSHMASLRSLTDVHFCGGSIVSNRYVLTSATCVSGRALNQVRVVVGTVTLNTGGAIHVSSNITLHPLYDRITLDNDVALVYTATAMAFTVNVQPIPISSTIFAGGVSVQISGWGTNTQGGGQAPNNLQRLTTTTISNDECRGRFHSLNADRITDRKICTLTRSTEGTCYGDEGGGLVSGGQLIGIASWQVPCATGVPDVFERIAAHRLWITSFI
ncbi:Chymotrypsin-2 [Pseudolycoriella hygida]|uniref:Chymotrypsin-2 n=1 Tax=Pseudolycoriella hygida TaxID=35572 RepID=A0A9Q0NCY3_9DIPT|nr:Chymotrypsin-2 [Pseudolycoriella hygida]